MADPTMVNYNEVVAVFGTSVPQGNAQINGIGIPRVSTKQLYCNGTTVLKGDVTIDNTLTVSNIITSSGDLTFNPAGNINFSGRPIIGAGSITTNPNRYEVTAASPVYTVDATPTLLYSLSTMAGGGYLMRTEVIAMDTAGNTAAFMLDAKAKNVSGTAIIGNNIEFTHDVDAPLTGLTVSYIPMGVDVGIWATGIADNIKWFGATSVTRVL